MMAPNRALKASQRDSWYDKDSFPIAKDDWSTYYPLIGLKRPGRTLVEKQITSANLLHPVLVASPDTGGRYLPPYFLAPERVARRVVRGSSVLLIGSIAILVFGAVGFYIGADLWGTLGYVATMGVVCGYAAFSYLSFARHPEQIEERWLFYAWSLSRPPTFSRLFLMLMVVTGLGQLAAINVLGSNDSVRATFGVVYETVGGSSQYWRLLTGPYLHNSLSHWLANTLVGTGLLLVYGPFLGWRSAIALVAGASGSLLSVYFVAQVIPLEAEGIVGISGGVAAIVGCFLALNLRFPRHFPRRFYLATMFVASSALLVSSFVLSLGSFIAHASGLLIGLILGFVPMPGGDESSVSRSIRYGGVP